MKGIAQSPVKRYVIAVVSADMILEAVGKAATATLPKGSFVRAFTKPVVDSDGNDALVVTLVVEDLSARPISGDQALDTILRVRQDLEKVGEQRSASVEFATEVDVVNGDA